MSLHKYHDVTPAAYTEYLQSHRKLILMAILLKISQIILKIVYIQKKEK